MIPWYIPPRVLFTITDWTYPFWFVILLLWFASAMVAQIYRYRRVSTRAQQLQTKWVVFGMIASFIGYFGATFPFVLFPTLAHAGLPAMQYEFVRVLLTDLTALLLPITLGIAILRYRLWNIDLIINRTVLYVSLTAILAGLYAASITLSQKMFVALTGEASDAAIVLTTLVIVSAATPLKERLETVVDKRFKAPTERLHALQKQVLSYIQILDVEQLVSRFLNDAVATFDAVSGAAFLDKDGEQQLVHTCGLWTGEARLSVPLEKGKDQLGMIALGRRRDGSEYSTQDRAILARTAFLISRAIELVERIE
jgi:hypothetical protein